MMGRFASLAAAILILLAVPCRLLAAPSLDKAARDLAAQLNEQLPLDGKTIKISDNLFWEQRTRVNLPFSSPLRDALATAVAAYGARVSLQEIGTEPLVMTGDYEIFRSEVTVTVEIRHMGETASRALAMARTRIQMNELPAQWFQPEFSRIAKTMIRYLEENYHGVDKFEVEIPLPKPGLPGQPPLMLGRFLKKHLEEAVASSVSFLPKGEGVGSTRVREAVPAVLEATYSEIGNGFMLALQVKDTKGGVVTAAQLTVDKKDIPKDLLEPLNEKGVTVTVVYKGGGMGAIPRSHPSVQSILASVRETLAKHGVNVRDSDTVGPGDSLVVFVVFRAGKSRTYNGLIAFNATADFLVKDVKTGKVIANLTKSGRMMGRGGPYGANEVLVRLADDLGSKGAKELVASILGRT